METSLRATPAPSQQTSERGYSRLSCGSPGEIQGLENGSTEGPLGADRKRGRTAAAQAQPKRLNCTAGSVAVGHGEGFFRILTLAGGSTRWIPACSAGGSIGSAPDKTNAGLSRS